MTSETHIADTLFDKLTEAIEENGSLTEATRKKLTMMALLDIHQNTKCLPDIIKRVEKLEDKSIWMWVEKHPKGAITIILLFITLASVWVEVYPRLLPLLK